MLFPLADIIDKQTVKSNNDEKFQNFNYFNYWANVY